MPYFLHPLWRTDISRLSDDQMWEHYEKCLRAHDWTYNYSDDGGVWKAGTEQRDHLNRVRQAVRKIDSKRADDLYAKYSPWTNENTRER